VNLAVVGAGYVGLVTAAVFAEMGCRVTVVEISGERVKKLQEGEIPFYEPGLDGLITKNLQSKNLIFTQNYDKAIPGAEVIFICVGTPTKNGRVDLSFVYEAVKSVAKNLKSYAILVIKSTVPPGINSKIEKKMRRFTRAEFDVASVPEFLREGKAVWDTFHPYRVVIGSVKKKVIHKLLQLHRGIPGKRLVCTPVSAQLIKYASNAFLPTKISFANSIAVLCDEFGADVEEVMKGVGMDKRIGAEFLGAGLGYGGSCFPKDIAALIHLAKRSKYNFEILKAVEKTNKKQIDYFIGRTVGLCGGEVKGKVLVILGLAFKPDTSDMREARSIYVAERLQNLGAEVRACDPVAIPEAEKLIKGARFFTDPYTALRGADALLLVTEWGEYKTLDFARIKKLMKAPVVVDGRNIYNRKQLVRLGFKYGGVGR